MTLLCDPEAFKFFQERGIVSLYDDVKFLTEPKGIDAHTFWSYPKLIAVQETKAPCCVIDTDCVLWRKLPYAPEAVALHKEPLEFGTYGYNKMWDCLHKILPDDLKGHRMIEPYNTAVLAFNDDIIRRAYANTALTLMHEYTAMEEPAQQGNSQSGGGELPIREIIFAEQLLLAILADKLQFRVQTLAEYDPGTDHMNSANEVMHLWNSKRFLKQHARARDQYLKAVMEELYEFRSSNRWSTIAAAIHKCGLPTVRVEETNWDTVRWSYAGEWVGPGETAVTI